MTERSPYPPLGSQHSALLAIADSDSSALPEDAYEPAKRTSRCTSCGGPATADRHYPAKHSGPVDRFYCARCDAEWWIKPHGGTS